MTRVSLKAKSFVRSLLKKRAYERLKAEQALNHSWLTGKSEIDNETGFSMKMNFKARFVLSKILLTSFVAVKYVGLEASNQKSIPVSNLKSKPLKKSKTCLIKKLSWNTCIVYYLNNKFKYIIVNF